MVEGGKTVITVDVGPSSFTVRVLVEAWIVEVDGIFCPTRVVVTEDRAL